MNFFNHLWHRKFSTFTLIVFALNISACANTGGVFTSKNSSSQIQSNINYVKSFPDVDINSIAKRISKDTFKIGDTADVNIYQVEDLSDTYVIGRDGNINFPLIGSVQVAGLTTTQLQKTLTEKYGSSFLRTPGINVKLESSEIGSVVVDGAVNKPGVFEVNDIIRLSEAIALAEGINQIDTTGSQIYIIRYINGERKVTQVDLREIRTLGANDPKIIPDDVIFVQDTSGRVLFREFLRTVPLLNTAVILSTRR